MESATSYTRVDVKITWVHQEWLQSNPEWSKSCLELTHKCPHLWEILIMFKIFHKLPRVGMPFLRVLQQPVPCIQESITSLLWFTYEYMLIDTQQSFDISVTRPIHICGCVKHVVFGIQQPCAIPPVIHDHWFWCYGFRQVWLYSSTCLDWPLRNTIKGLLRQVDCSTCGFQYKFNMLVHWLIR